MVVVHANFSEIDRVAREHGFEAVDGILFDLGVSSMQLDTPGRGFSFQRDEPLDMRMDQSTGLTAADILNTYDARALTRVLREYGEEKFAQLEDLILGQRCFDLERQYCGTHASVSHGI